MDFPRRLRQLFRIGRGNLSPRIQDSSHGGGRRPGKPPRHHTYGEFCERINAIYEQYTDQVERFSVDESWLDVTGSLHLFGDDPVELAKEIQSRVHEEIGITISIGISWNKMFAKLGSDLNKPNGITLISREDFRQVVWTLPVGDFFGVGRNTAETLNKRYIRTIGDLAATDEATLTRLLGKMGAELKKNANGLDDSPVNASAKKTRLNPSATA